MRAIGYYGAGAVEVLVDSIRAGSHHVAGIENLVTFLKRPIPSTTPAASQPNILA
jgi:hypothetical protein